jgi:nucleoside-diphosphate-sugar epimerase
MSASPKQLPEKISTVAELEDILSTPSEALIQSMKRLNGDIMVLGAGGKVGPTMAMLAKRAMDAAGVKKKVIAVDVAPLAALEKKGIEAIKCDMMDLDAMGKLPKVENIVYMVGRKFGSTGSEHLTWAVNVIVPYHAARTFTKSRIAAFSTGCVYPVMDIKTGGATEQVPANPIGEYAMSCLGRERMFDVFAEKGEKVVHIRLNYAVELRYGVLSDIAVNIWNGKPVDVTTGFANVIWQGDACNQVLQSLEYASSPARILNVTGPETFSIREVAHTFGRLMGKKAIVEGQENGMGYLNNARQANALFGNPTVPLGKVIEWIAHWVKAGGETSGKPTHFETQDGKY